MKYKIQEFFDPRPKDKKETIEEYLRRIPPKYSIRYLKYQLATLSNPDDYELEAIDSQYEGKSAKAVHDLCKTLILIRIRFETLLREIENTV